MRIVNENRDIFNAPILVVKNSARIENCDSKELAESCFGMQT